MIELSYIYRKIKERRKLYTSTPRAKLIRKKMNLALIKNDILNRPHIFRIELVNTLNCNAKCLHCSNHKLCSDSNNISPKIVERILIEAKKNKTPSITFLGGEALLDKNITGYLKLFVEADMGVTLSTNALLVSEKLLTELKNIGVAGLGTTIYDAFPEKHDEVVGVKGAFKKINKAIALCKELNISFSLATVYTKEIAKNGALDRLMEFAFNNNKSLKINLVAPVGGSANEDSMLTKDEINNIKNKILSDSRLSTHCIFNKANERCPMGRTYVGILPGGEMLPCYFMPFYLGNIKDTSFGEYLSYAKSFSIFRKDGLPKGFCLVAESKKFFREIIEPIFKSGVELPINLKKDKALEQKIRNFKLEENE